MLSVVTLAFLPPPLLLKDPGAFFPFGSASALGGEDAPEIVNTELGIGQFAAGETVTMLKYI